MHGQKLTSGNIKRQLWDLAWPIMLSVFFHTLYNVVDTFWVAKLAPEAIAAVSISQVTLFVMLSLSMGITIGSGVLMGMNIGAKNMKGAQRILGQSFVLSAIAGVFFTIIALIFKNQFLTASGATGAILPLALPYFTVTAAGSMLLFIMFSVVFGFNAQGDNKTLAFLFSISTLFNVVLDPLFIFGYGPMPALGIAGAAYATLISQVVFIVMGLRILSSEKMMIPFSPKYLRMKLDSVKEVLRIGIPASLTNVLNPLGIAALLAISSHFFQESGAVAMSLAFRVEFFAFLPAVGFGFAGMAMISQNIGAQQIERALKAYRTALLYAFASASVIGIVALLFAKQLIGVFTHDPVVTSYTSLYLLSVTLTYGFLASIFVITNAFQAVGKSWPGFYLTLTKLFIITIPLALLLITQTQSIMGLWSAALLGNVVTPVLGFFWYRYTVRHLKKSEVPVRAH